MEPKDKRPPVATEATPAHTGIAAQARELADTEGITVAAAVEKLTKKAAEKDVG